MKRRKRWLLHLAFAAVGVGGATWLAQHVGIDRVLTAASEGLPWFFIVVVLEGVRIACDAFATHLLLRGRAPLKPLLGAHLAAYPLILLFPAGRAAGEAAKVVLLGPHAGYQRAAAAGIYNQALPLLAGFAISIPTAAVVGWRLGWLHALTVAVAVQSITAIGLGLAILVAARRRTLSQWLRKLSSEAGITAEGIQAHMRELGFLPRGPFGAILLGRLVLALQLITLGVGVASGSWSSAISLLGAHLVGAAAGDLIPAQIGATDGSLAWSASSLGIATAEAVAIALLMHGAQLLWAALGGLAALGMPQSTPHSASHSSPPHSSRSKSPPPAAPH